MDDPLVIYSRLDLNRMLLERAERAGAQIEKARVMEISRHGSRWQLRTSAGMADADFCIVATGARNPLRDVGTELQPQDAMSALGYYVPGDQERIDIQFLPHLEGYIWIFPRCGHLSVGICGKNEPASSLRKRLERFMTERGIAWKGAAFYSHLLPSLDAAVVAQQPRGRRRLDGGGRRGRPGGSHHRRGPLLRHPLGRPGGARAAFRSRRAGREDDATTASCCAAISRPTWNSARGSPSASSCGRFLCSSVPARMVQFTRRSPRFSAIMQDLFAGRQPYPSLKRRLLRNLNGSLYEIGHEPGFQPAGAAQGGVTHRAATAP